jgi:hypothetical protein
MLYAGHVDGSVLKSSFYRLYNMSVQLSAVIGANGKLKCCNVVWERNLMSPLISQYTKHRKLRYTKRQTLPFSSLYCSIWYVYFTWDSAILKTLADDSPRHFTARSYSTPGHGTFIAASTRNERSNGIQCQLRSGTTICPQPQTKAMKGWISDSPIKAGFWAN